MMPSQPHHDSKESTLNKSPKYIDRLQQFVELKDQIIVNDHDTALIVMTEEHSSPRYGFDLHITPGLYITTGSARAVAERIHQVFDEVIAQRSSNLRDPKRAHAISHARFRWFALPVVLTYVLSLIVTASFWLSLIPAAVMVGVILTMLITNFSRWKKHEVAWMPLSQKKLLTCLQMTSSENHVFLDRLAQPLYEDIITPVVRDGLMELHQENESEAYKALEIILMADQQRRNEDAVFARRKHESESMERINRLVVAPYRAEAPPSAQPPHTNPSPESED